MTSPQAVDIEHLDGKWWLQDTQLSDALEPVLKGQNVPYLARKAMLLANISETIQTKTSPNGIKALVVTKAAAGLKGHSDTFDGTGEQVMMGGSGYFGGEAAAVRSWWVDDLASATHAATGKPLDPYLLEGWNDEGKYFVSCGDKSNMSDVSVWGFCVIGGKRYRAVKYYIRNGDQEVRARIVYAWAGKE
ncbi:hypothetical protein Micbo1qcDRAFT_209684 [Microdochium bolleyi]|uniref:Uncharacterized protein n=1 Tax=Microdochium bolleyi TaxID=196109 RepID=A0A136ILT5_9PEZI|nr:hypothetical protein Micbo1qcDRAFT_209684 [Microdochium bolleyi]